MGPDQVLIRTLSHTRRPFLLLQEVPNVVLCVYECVSVSLCECEREETPSLSFPSSIPVSSCVDAGAVAHTHG